MSSQKHATAGKSGAEFFTNIRQSEFFSEDELTKQLGVEREQWPLAVIGELVDNGLDACEEARVAPEIVIIVEQDRRYVAGNGPGIPKEVVDRKSDYEARVNTRVKRRDPTYWPFNKWYVADLTDTQVEPKIELPFAIAAVERKVDAMTCAKPQTASETKQLDRIYALFPLNEPRTLTHREVNLCLKCLRNGPYPTEDVTRLVVLSLSLSVTKQPVGNHLLLRVGRAIPLLATASIRPRIESTDWSNLPRHDRPRVVAMLRRMRYSEQAICSMLGVSRATVTRAFRGFTGGDA